MSQETDIQDLQKAVRELREENKEIRRRLEAVEKGDGLDRALRARGL